MAQSENWIKQINAAGVSYDIAVAHGITFTQTGAADRVWDGTVDLTVAIPTLADIVSSPVVFAGTVASDDTITWADGYSAAAKGYLVYITAACSFAGQACEPGDMAICTGVDGNNPTWAVITGENQWSFGSGSTDGNRTTISVGSEVKDILTIEGKTLALSIPLVTTKNSGVINLSLSDATFTTSPVYLKLSQAASSSIDVGAAEAISISIPTALASNVVSLTNASVLTSDDFTFTSGALASATKNANAVSATVSHNLEVSGTFVTDVTAIKSVSFETGSASDLGYVGALTSADGASFINGIHVYDSTKDDGKPIDLTLWGSVSADASVNTFATGFGAESSTKGDGVVSDVTVGTVSANTTGSDFLRGLDGAATSVITSVTFGSASKSADQWFYDGLVDGSDVVTDVTVGAVALESDSSSNFAASALISATVSDHVLSFSTDSFMTPVKLSKTADTITKKGFSKAGVSLTGFSSSAVGFLKGGITQAATVVSYKSLATGSVSLTQASASYFFDKAASTTYSPVMSYVKLSVVDATVSTGSPSLTNTTITATIPANTFVDTFTAGTLPSLTIAAPSTTITGTVGTELSFGSEISWLPVDPATREFNLPGAYTLVSVNKSDSAGAVIAAADSTYAISGSAKALIPESAFVTDVTFAS